MTGPGGGDHVEVDVRTFLLVLGFSGFDCKVMALAQVLVRDSEGRAHSL
jgi:hypothetical protein